MHLVLFVSGVSQPGAQVLLGRARRVLEQAMPAFPVPLSSALHLLPEICGGWLTFEPALPSLPKRLHTSVAPDLALMIYGELFGVEEHETAQVVASAWRSGGARSVRLLDGCFSCIVVDRSQARFTVLSDTIGRRSLRFFQDGNCTAVSTHDAAIVATGLLTPCFNLDAVASAAAIDWSLGGKSFLNGVTTIEPDEYVIWSGGNAKHEYDPPSMNAQRLHAGQKKEIAEQLSRIADHLVSTTAAFCGSAGPIKADLTAGVDTRTVLALLLAGVEKERITVCTEGQEDDLDVIVARKIAASYGVTHEVMINEPPEPDRFIDRLDVLAFSTNGDTDGKRALTNIFRKAEFSDPTRRLCGHGALYRGPYYPLKGRRDLLSLRQDDVVRHFQRKFNRIHRLPWKDGGVRDRLNGLLASRVERYARIAGHPVDLLDLFFFYERYSRHGSLWARCSWWSQYFDPLSNNTVLRLAFQLPAPISCGASVNRAILARYLKRAYYFHLINGKGYGPALRSPVLSRRLGKVLAMVQNIRSVAGRRLEVARPLKQNVLDDWFAAQFKATTRCIDEEVLLSSGSLTSRILTEEGVRSMFDDLAHPGSGPGAIGVLLSVERWREQIQKIWNLSRRQTLCIFTGVAWLSVLSDIECGCNMVFSFC